MKTIGILSLVLSFVFISADKSINIERGAGSIEFFNGSFDEAKKLAKKENKLIFIDCYTSWCKPCKEMAATTFTNPQVAGTYNDKFINFKVDIEKDKDGPKIQSKYRVNQFPTLLFVNSKGDIVLRTIGKKSVSDMLDYAKRF